MFKKKKVDIPKVVERKEAKKDIIIPVYLNQRVVYDTLAIINDGFTELYNFTNASSDSQNKDVHVSGRVETSGNPLTFMKASLSSDIVNGSDFNKSDKSEFQKVHTPTSLFSKVYDYIIDNDKLKRIEKESDLEEISCSDFVEFRTFLKINTIEEGFRNMLKMSQISEIFLNFANDPDSKKQRKDIEGIKNNIVKLTNYLDLQNEKIKYMVGKIENKDIVIKINRDCIIDADYEQINNGNFRIIGKVLEIIDENQQVNLNRESVLGYIKDESLIPIKEAIEGMSNTMFDYDSIQDCVIGRTIIVLPIVIGL